MMLGSGMINSDAIVLDAKNNTFVGPNGFFKLVVDQFDGKEIKAWHIEDAKGNKSRNLILAGPVSTLDAVIGNVDRFAFPDHISNLKITKPEFVNSLLMNK